MAELFHEHNLHFYLSLNTFEIYIAWVSKRSKTIKRLIIFLRHPYLNQAQAFGSPKILEYFRGSMQYRKSMERIFRQQIYTVSSCRHTFNKCIMRHIIEKKIIFLEALRLYIGPHLWIATLWICYQENNS